MDNLPIFHGGKLIGRIRNAPEPDNAYLVFPSIGRPPSMAYGQMRAPVTTIITSVTVRLVRAGDITIGTTDDPGAMLGVKGYERLVGGLFVGLTDEWEPGVERVARAMCRQYLHGELAVGGAYEAVLEKCVDLEWSWRFGRLAYVAIMTMEGSKRDDRG